MTESTELAPFEQLKERMASKLRDDFSDLIPDEVFQEIINKSIQEAEQQLQAECKKILREMMQEKIKDTINSSNEWNVFWDSNLQKNSIPVAEAALKEMLTQDPSVLFQAMFAPMMGQFLYEFKQRLQSGY